MSMYPLAARLRGCYKVCVAGGVLLQHVFISFSPAHSSRIVLDVVLLAALINRVGWRLSDAL